MSPFDVPPRAKDAGKLAVISLAWEKVRPFVCRNGRCEKMFVRTLAVLQSKESLQGATKRIPEMWKLSELDQMCRVG